MKQFVNINVLSDATGVLCPHFLVFANSTAAADFAPGAVSPDEPRLAVGAARTRDFLPEEIGRAVMATHVRDAVLLACQPARVPVDDLCSAQIKCPSLTPARVAAAGGKCATEDCHRSMAMSRGAASLGVALAGGEVTAVSDEDVCLDFSKSSAVASASAGVASSCTAR